MCDYAGREFGRCLCGEVASDGSELRDGEDERAVELTLEPPAEPHCYGRLRQDCAIVRCRVGYHLKDLHG